MVRITTGCILFSAAATASALAHAVKKDFPQSPFTRIRARHPRRLLLDDESDDFFFGWFTATAFCPAEPEEGGDRNGNNESHRTVRVWRLLAWFHQLFHPNHMEGTCGSLCEVICNHQPCVNDLEVPGDDEELCICLGNAETNCIITNSKCNVETDTCVCRDGFIGNASTSCVDVDTVIPIGDGGDDSDSGGGGGGGGQDSDVDAPSPSPSLSPDSDEDKGIASVEESSPSHEDEDDDMDPAAIFGLAVAAMVIMALIALFLPRHCHRRNEGDTTKNAKNEARSSSGRRGRSSDGPKHHPHPSMANRSLGSLSGEHFANEDQDVELNNRLQLDVSPSYEDYNFCFGRALTQDDHNKNQNVELSNRLRSGDSSSRFYKETESRFGMYPEGRTEALTQDVHKCNSATCELCVQSRHSIVKFLPVQTKPMAQ